MHGANIPVDNPIIGVAPDAIAKATERGMATRATVIAGPMFSLTSLKYFF